MTHIASVEIDYADNYVEPMRCCECGRDEIELALAGITEDLVIILGDDLCIRSYCDECR